MTAINCLSRLYHYLGNRCNRKETERVYPYVVRSELSLILDSINANVFETVLGISSQFSTDYPFHQFSASFDRRIDANAGRLIVEFKVERTFIEGPGMDEENN